MLHTRRDILFIALGIILVAIIPLIPTIINPSSWSYPTGTSIWLIIIYSLIALIIIGVVIFLVYFIFKQIRSIDTKLEDKEDERHKELLEAIKGIKPIVYYQRSSYGIRKQRKY